MTQTWNKEKCEDESCEKCGSTYAVTVMRFPVKERDEFKCVVCGTLMRSWKSTYSWSYELKEKKENHL
jgi:hypothetical protein